MKVTLGGDRLGSGNKNKIALRNYERSTHNLSQRWTSSMAPGILYPFLCIPAMRGDKFEIDLEAAARTIPTQGPLFGSYKMQIDIFQCPMRLYQAILHNNPTAIGLKMNQVKLPLLEIKSTSKTNDREYGLKFSNSCLMKYLGVSGLGHNNSLSNQKVGRYFNAVPALAYYDIFKTYYSNKQEENAYVIGIEQTFDKSEEPYKIELKQAPWGNKSEIPMNSEFIIRNPYASGIPGTNAQYTQILMYTKGQPDTTRITQYELTITDDNGYNSNWKISELNNQINETVKYAIYQDKNKNWITYLEIDNYKLVSGINEDETRTNAQYTLSITNDLDILQETNTLKIQQFPLKNIDGMRLKLLSHNNLGTPFRIINDETDADGTWDKESGATGSNGRPYTNLINQDGEEGDEKTWNVYSHNGLVLKTYQSDLFNNWINTDWIDGENGIAAITAISTATGDKFTIDALNLAEKLYNMLNRIAVSGGTYEDWQDAVYTESPRRHIESPTYLGGMSNEIVFEEIVQSAPATTEEGTSELGTLGGRGVLIKRKGGNVTCRIDEASFIIGIVSLTPRLMYTQGNEFYMTDLFTLDDLHKPALDGIGFENLIAERAAWWDAQLNAGNVGISSRRSLGKVPAWINYMTAVDKAFGDFADTDGKSFMVLGRNYEMDQSSGTIKDATTYIDPTKFNYAFAYTELDAQNFWVQIQSNIRARRLMSAKQIPNI